MSQTLGTALGTGLVALTLIMSAALTPRVASADASQLCRSLTMIALAPTDILLAPVTTANDIRIGLDDQDDHWLAITLGIIPGYVWLNYLQVGGAILRVAAGTLEIIPGLLTLPREKSPDPLFASQDEAEAVFSQDVGPCPIRIGVHYNTIIWG